MEVTLTLEELENLLNEQKRVTAEYITRNLTIYPWFEDLKTFDIITVKNSIKTECYKSGHPNDISILRKYIKK